MSEMPPMSPRERMLREDEPAEITVLPTAEERAQAAEAAAQARAEAEEEALTSHDLGAGPPDLDDLTGDGDGEAVEVFQVQELEQQLTRLEALADAGIPVHQVLSEADDALQGIAVILAMGFSGDVQMIVLAALQRYRKLHGYTG